MSLFDFFLKKRPATASVAKERLQIVLAHERATRDGPDYLPALQRDLLAVVAKYVVVRDDMLRVKVGREGNASVLEINVEVELPPVARRGAGAAHAAA
jgi:cell division topological specificity factor